ncbi:MAG: hypothetical protein ABR861_09635 [Terriglobales bacterium]
MESMFREKGDGRVEMPPKIGIHTMPGAFIHAMRAEKQGTKSTDPAANVTFLHFCCKPLVFAAILVDIGTSTA